MPSAPFTTSQLREELARYEAELENAGLADATIHTYIERAERFIRWLEGEYRPGPRDSG